MANVNLLYRTTTRPRDGHAARLERLIEALRAREPGPVRFGKRAVSHVVPKRHRAHGDVSTLDVRDFDRILEIDVDARTCTAEPGVTFARLVSATLRHGLVPVVVPELKTITVGGAVAGCSLESMSFRYGGFHDSCFEYEVVTADGDVIRCRPDGEHSLVFHMMNGTFGTLGFVSQLKFRLVRARPFVHVTYETHPSWRDASAAIERHAADPRLDFMDGILHAPDQHVLCLGRFVDDAPYHNRYDWMKVYYRSTATRPDDYLETKDYFFRYDHGVTNVHPKSAAGRLLFGKVFDSSRLLWLANKLHRFLPDERPPVTLDVFVPLSRTGEFLEWFAREMGHFPLWCVPYRRVHDYPWLSPDFFAGLRDELFVDLAIYGMEQPSGRNCYREIEECLARVNGVKTLISHNYYDEAEFWKIWNRPNYRAVKRLTDPRGDFGDLFVKTCRRGL